MLLLPLLHAVYTAVLVSSLIIFLGLYGLGCLRLLAEREEQERSASELLQVKQNKLLQFLEII